MLALVLSPHIQVERLAFFFLLTKKGGKLKYFLNCLYLVILRNSINYFLSEFLYFHNIIISGLQTLLHSEYLKIALTVLK